MFVVGLTGGIGSGKSTVSDEFNKLGIEIVDADQASREVVKPGSQTLEEIADHFGDPVLSQDGTLNRTKLRQVIFANEDERKWLESLLHPLIIQWIYDRIRKADSPYVILEAPLLLETSRRLQVDRILVVDVPESVQLSRTVARDANPESLVKTIIESQMSREERLRHADDIIENTGTLDQLQQQVKELHIVYLEMSAKK